MILSAGESSIMPKTVIPAGYRPALGLYDTQKAIGLIKQIDREIQHCSPPSFVPRSIFSMGLPLANSSMSLSR